MVQSGTSAAGLKRWQLVAIQRRLERFNRLARDETVWLKTLSTFLMTRCRLEEEHLGGEEEREGGDGRRGPHPSASGMEWRRVLPNGRMCNAPGCRMMTT